MAGSMPRSQNLVCILLRNFFIFLELSGEGTPKIHTKKKLDMRLRYAQYFTHFEFLLYVFLERELLMFDCPKDSEQKLHSKGVYHEQFSHDFVNFL